MSNYNFVEAQVYVSTYSKYNAGSISGKWLKLDDYADYEDFIAACRELHSDEDDPEFMFQDFEGIPDFFYSESRIDPEVWDWLMLSDEKKSQLEAYIKHVGEHYCTCFDQLIQEMESDLHCTAASFEDFAGELLIDSIGQESYDHVRSYMDMEHYAKELPFSFMDGYIFSN